MLRAALWYHTQNYGSRFKVTTSGWHVQLEAGLENDLRCVGVQLAEWKVWFVRERGDGKEWD